MPHDPYAALYIHVPFCASKCAYCDFHSSACPTGSPRMEAFVDELVLTLKRKAHEGELAGLRTIYIGGGTPTHLGHALLTRLLYAIGLYVNLERIEELTIEANPESLTEAMVKDAWALGANRISIGVQSFDDALLSRIGRAHDGARAEEAVTIARTRFENVSIDLMCGLPGQTREGFARDVERALGLGIVHLSVYPLSVERGTPLYRALRRGSEALPDDDAVADMLEDAEVILEGAGFSRYEVASYSLPGFSSRHNAVYWQGQPYLGLGESATTMTQNAQRRMRVKDGVVIDDLDEAQMAAEDLMLAMRMSRGADEALIARVCAILPDTPRVLASLVDRGLLVRTGEALVPTELGWLCGNELYSALLDLAP